MKSTTKRQVKRWGDVGLRFALAFFMVTMMTPTEGLKAMAEEAGITATSTGSATAETSGTTTSDQATATEAPSATSGSEEATDTQTTTDTSSTDSATSSTTSASAAPTATATQEALPAAPGNATTDATIRTASAQDAVPGKHATAVTATQGGLTLKTEAAWLDTTHADGNYNATDTLTVSGIAAAKQALADANTPAADSKVSVSEIIASDWTIDITKLESNLATEKVQLATEGIDESYAIDWVTYKDDGSLKTVDEGTANSYARITYTLDFANATVDTTSVGLPLTLAESARGNIDAYEAIANDTSATYTNTADGDGTLYTGGTAATLGATTVTATSPELQVTAEPAAVPAATEPAATEPATTSEDAPLAPMSEEPVLTAQSANGQQAGFKVGAYNVIGVTDGTATFNSNTYDGTNNAGQDANGTNGVVRSNDDIIYKASYKLDTLDESGNTGSGYYAGTNKIKLTATMPDDLYNASNGTAYWDTNAMAWLETPEVSADGKTITGYMTIAGTNQNNPLAPRVGVLNWVLNTGWATNGTVATTPTFTFAPADAGGAYTEAPITAGNESSSTSTTVTAKGSYNARLKNEGGNLYSVTLQFYNAEGGLKGQELPDTTQPITVTLKTNWNQTYQDAKLNTTDVAGNAGVITAAQYGASAPWDDGATTLVTTFNKVYNGGVVSGSGTPGSTNSSTVDNSITLTISNYQIDMSNTTGFRAGSNLIYPDRTSSAPSTVTAASFDDTTTYNFGSYIFKVATPSGYASNQTGITGTVTIDSAAFPTPSGVSGDTVSTDNTENRSLSTSGAPGGPYSYPYNENASVVRPDTGPGSSFHRVSSDGTPVTDLDQGGYGYISLDNSYQVSSEHVYFIRQDSLTISSAVPYANYNCFDNIPKYDTIFYKFNDQLLDIDDSLANQTNVGYYPVSEVSTSGAEVVYKPMPSSACTYKYVAKEGGWENDDDQMSAHLSSDASGHFFDASASGLQVFDSLEALRSAQNIDANLRAVGVVADIEIPSSVIDELIDRSLDSKYSVARMITRLNTFLKVRNDALIDKTTNTQITSQTDPKLVGIGTSDYSIRSVDGNNATVQTFQRLTGTSTSNNWQNYADAPGEEVGLTTTTNYKKATLNASGGLNTAPGAAVNLIFESPSTNNIAQMAGFSFALKMWSPYVSKGIAQTTSSSAKTNWSIDQGQRRIDYTIAAGVSGAASPQSTDTLTITDTIPSGEYAVSSSSDPATAWNITYANTGSTYTADSTTNGGAGGSWSNDVTNIEQSAAWQAVKAAGYSPSLELTSSTDSTGATTLTWKITGWAVGYAAPDIHYSAILGTPNDIFTDLPNGTTKTNTASASTTDVPQTVKDDQTVTVIRQQAASAVKGTSDQSSSGTTDNMRDNTSTPAGFDITFQNDLEKSENNNASIVDVFPTTAAGNLKTGYDDPNYTDKNGTTWPYSLANVSLESKSLAGSTLTFYYATNTSLAAVGKSAVDLASVQTTNAASGYSFPSSDGWLSISCTIGSDGTVDAASAAAIKSALENPGNGAQVVAVGFKGTALSPGAAWKLHYNYDWKTQNGQEPPKAEILSEGNFYNALSYYSDTAKVGTTSTADSLPLVTLGKVLASDNGTKATYTITLTNSSLDAATNYKIYDDPTNLSGLQVTSAVDQNGTDVKSTVSAYDTTNKTFTVSTIPANSTITLTVAADIVDPTATSTNNTRPNDDGDSSVTKTRVSADKQTDAATNVIQNGDDVWYHLNISNNSDNAIESWDSVATDQFQNLTYQGTGATTTGTVSGVQTKTDASGNTITYVTWNPGTVAANSSADVWLHFTVNAGSDATYVNNEVTSHNHSSVVTDPIVSASLDKTLVSAAGGKATYNINVTNTGKVDATNWTFDENLTAMTTSQDAIAVAKVTDANGAEVTNSGITATYNGTNNTITLSSLPVGYTVTLSLVGTTTANDFTNTVRPDNPNNTNDGDWTISKTRVKGMGSTEADTSKIVTGSDVYYMVKITNNSTSQVVSAADSKVTDTFTNLTYVENGNVSQGTVTAPAAGANTLTWEPGEIAKATSATSPATATMWVHYTVASGDYVSNKAKADNHVSIVTDLVPSLDISKKLGSYDAATKKATYTIAVHNASAIDAAPVTFTENYDDSNLSNMSVAEATDTQGVTASQVGNTSGSTVTLTKVPAGATVNVTVSFDVTSTAKSFKNIATINTNATSSIDKQAYGAYDEATGTFSGEIKDGTAVTKGQTIYYKVTRTATGATGSKTITDTLSDGLTYVGSSASDGVTPSVNGKVVTWNSAAFTSAGSSYLMVKATIDNTGTYNAVSNAATDGNTTVVITNPLPKVSLSKTFSSYDATAGTVTYELAVSNTGLGDASAYPIDIVDEADSNLAYVGNSLKVTQAAAGETATTGDGKAINATVKAGDTVKFEMTFKLVDTSKGAKNTAYVPNEPGEDLTKQAFDAAGNEIKDWDTVYPGEEITYVVTRTNTATDGASVLAGTTITDTLSDGITYVVGSASTTDGVAPVANGQVITWNCADITANTAGTASSKLTFKAIVGQGTDINVIANSVTDGVKTVVITNPLSHVTPTKTLKSIVYNADGTATATYDVNLNNTGAAAVGANGYTFDDSLTNGTIITNDANHPITNATYSDRDDTFTNSVAIPAGESIDVTYSATIADASKEGINGVKPHDSSWDLTKTRVTALGSSDPDTSALHVGEVVYYKVTIDNHNGTADLTKAMTTVTDTFKNLTYVGAFSDATTADPNVTPGANGAYTWTPGDVAKGATASVWLKFTVSETATDGKSELQGTVANTATADEHTVVVHDPVIKVTDKKDVTNVVYDANGNATVTYTVTVENKGAVPVSGYQLSEKATNGTINADSFTLTAPATGVKVDYQATDASSGIVTIDRLAAGVTVTFTYTAKVDAANLGSENQVKPVDSKWDLTKKRVSGNDGQAIDNTAVSVGDTVWYEITIDNTNGTKPVTASDAVVTDEFANLTYVGQGTVSQGSVTGTTNATNSSVTWEAGEVAAGATATVYLQFKVASTATDGTSANQYTAVNAAHADEHGTTIETPVVSVKADKSLASVKYNEDNTAVVTYDVVLTNNGKAAAKGYQLKDTMVNGSVASVSGANAVLNGDVITVGDDIPANGGTVTITVTANVDKADLEASNQVKPPISDWNLTKTRVADNESATPKNDALSVGDTVWYLVTVDNTNGTQPVSAADATVTDTFKNLVFVSAGTAKNADATLDTAKVVSTDTTTAADVTKVTFAPGEVAAGKTAQVWLQFKVSTTATDGATQPTYTVENKATADSHGTTTHDPVAQATLEKSAKKVVFSTDGTTATITYSVKVKNKGALSATNYVVKDAVTNGTLDAGSISDKTVTYDPATNSFTIPTVEAGGSVTFTYDVKVPVGQLDSTNKVSTPNPLVDTNKTRVDANGSTTTVTAAVQVGDTVWYRIAVTNNGNATATAAQTVVTDTFTNLTFLAAGTMDNDGTALDASRLVNNGDGTLTFNPGELAAGKTAEAWVSFKVPQSAIDTPSDVQGTVINSANGSVIVTPVISVEPTKTIDKVVYNADGTATVSYRVSLKNTGKAVAKGYQFAETMTNGKGSITITSNNATYANGIVTMTQDILANSDPVVVTYDATVDKADLEASNQVKPPTSDWNLTKTRVDAFGSSTTDGDALQVGDTVYYKVTIDNSKGTTDLAAATTKTTESFKNLTYVGAQDSNGGAVTLADNGDGTYTWEPGVVTKGTSASVWVSFTVAASATDGTSELQGTAENTVRADEHSTVTHDPVINAKATKNASAVDFSADGTTATITYTVTVKNSSTVAGKNVVLKDVIDNQATVNADSVQGAIYDAAKGTFTIAEVAAAANGTDGTATFTYTASVPVASLSTTNKINTPNPNVVTDKTRVDANGSTNAQTSSVKVGDTVWYRIAVTNNGNATATAAQTVVTDTFTNLTFLAAGSMDNDGTALDASKLVNNGDGTLTFNPGDLAAGKTAEAWVSFTVAQSAVADGSVTKDAAINSANGSVIVTPVVSVKPTKTLGSVVYNADGTATVTYDVALENTGDVVAKGYTFSDSMVNGTVTSVSDNATLNGSDITLKSDLAPSAKVTVTVTATVDKADLEASNQVKPPTSNWDLIKTRVTDNESSDAATGALSVGDTVWYKVTVDNTNGDAAIDAASAKVTDTFKNLTYVGAGSSTNGSNSLDSSKVVSTDNATAANVTTVTFAPGNVARGDTATVWLQFKVAGTATDGTTAPQGTVDNTASADEHSTTTHDPVVDAKALKTVDKVEYNADGTTATIHYRVTLTNSSALVAKNYVVKDVIDNSATINADSVQGATYNPGDQSFTVAEIPAAANGTAGTATITYTASVPVASLSTTNKIHTNNPDVVTDKARVDANGSTTTVNGQVKVGDTVWYRIAVTNNGTGTATAAQTVVTDKFANLDFASAGTMDNGGAALDASKLVNNGDGTLTFNPGELAAGKTAEAWVSFTVNASALDAGSDTAGAAINSVNGTNIVTPVISVEPTKTLSKIVYNADGTATATYKVTLKNTGKAVATKYQFDESMTNGKGNVSVTSGNATYANGTFTMTTDIAAGATTEVIYTVNVEKSALQASNQIKPHESDWDLTKTRVDAIGSSTADDTTLRVGDTVYYKITIDNTNGTTDLAAATTKTTDSFKNLTYVGAADIDGNAVTLTDNGDGTYTWEPGVVKAKTSASVWVEFTVSATATDGKSALQGTVANTATADGHTVVTHDPVIDIKPSKDITKVTYNADGTTATVSYRVTLVNKSAIDVTDYQFTDKPANGNIIASTVKGATFDPDTSTFTVSAVPSGSDDITVTYDANVPIADLSGKNQVTPTNSKWSQSKIRVAGDGDETEVTGGVNVGDTVWYLVTIDNTEGTEPVSATDALTTDTFTNLTFLKFGKTSQGTTTTIDSSSFKWEPGEVAAGTKAQLWAAFTVSASALDNETEAQQNAHDTAINTANGTTIHTPVIEVKPTKTVNDITYNADGSATVNYQVVLENTGAVVARGYQFSDTMLNGTVIGTSDNASFENGTVTLKQDIAPGQAVTVNIKATVTKAELQASNQVKPHESDWDLTKTRVDGMGSSTAEDATLRVGDSVYYKITIDNTKGVSDLTAALTKTTEQFKNLTYVGASDSTGAKVTLGTDDSGNYTWEPGQVKAGNSASVWLEFKVAATATDGTSALQGTVENTASADEHTVVTHDPVIDVRNLKEATAVSYSADGTTATITYKVTVTNSGAVAANDYVLNDVIDNGATIKADSVTGATYSATDKTFTVATVPAGQSVEFTYTADVPTASLSTANKVTVTNPNVTTDKVRVTGNGSDTAATAELHVGDTVWYKITVKNSGDAIAPAAQTEVTDKFVNLTYLASGTVSQGNIDASAADAKSTVTFAPGDLAISGSATAWVSFKVAASAADDGAMSGAVCNTANGTVIVTPVVSVAPTKTLDGITYNADGSATVIYNVHLENTGKVVAKGYQFSDTMINGTGVKVTTNNATISGTTVTLKNDLNAGDSVDVKLSATVTKAELQASNQVKPVDSDWNLTKTRVGGLGSSFTSPVDSALSVGDKVYYKITVDNTTGAKDLAAAVTKTTEKFANLNYVTAMDENGATVDLAKNADGTYTWEPGVVLAGNSTSLWLEFTVASTATDGTSALQGTVENTASADEHTVVTHDPVINIKSTKSVSGVTYNGDGTATVSYEIKLENKSDIVASGVQVKDTLTNGSVIDGTIDGATFANGVFTVATIAPKATATITYQVKAPVSSLETVNQIKTPDRPWSLTKARVTGDNAETTVDSALHVGDDVWYLVTVDNTDGKQAISAADATVTDSFTNLNYVGAGTTKNGAATLTTSDVVTKNADGTISFAPGSVAAGEKAQVWLEFTVANSATDTSDAKYDQKFADTVVNSASADTHSTTVNDPVLDVTTEKNATKVVYNADDTATVSYSVDVYNKGTVDASGFTFKDATTNAAVDAGSVAGATFANDVFTVASVAAGKHVYVTYTATVADSTLEAKNQVKPTDSKWDLNKIRVTGDGSATPDTSNLRVGDDVWYLVTVDNTNGTLAIPASSALTSDTFTNLDYVGAGKATNGDANLVTSSVVSTTSADGKVTLVKFAPGEVAAGKTAQVWLHFTVDASATADPTSDMYDTVSNTASADTHSVNVTDPVISLTNAKKATDVTYNADGTATITYQVTLTNGNATTVKGYKLADTISNGGAIDATSITCANATVTLDGTTFTVDKIAGNSEVTFTYKATVDDSTLNTENQLKPEDSTWNLLKSRVTGDNSTTETSDAVSVGDTIWYKVTVDNSKGTKAVSATDATVTDTFANLTYVGNGTVTQGKVNTTTDASGKVTTVTFEPGEVAAGATADVWLQFKVSATATDGTSALQGTVQNSVKADEHGTNVDTPVIKANADKTISKVVYNNDGTAMVSYTVTLSNVSKVEAKNYAFADSFSNGTVNAGSVTGATFKDGVFTVASIAAATNDTTPGTATVTYTAKVAQSSLASTNKVKPVESPWDLTKLRVDADGSETAKTSSLNVGDTVWYLLTIDNTNGTEAISATDATVTDSFTNLTYVGAGTVSAGNVTGTAGASNSTITWTPGTVAAGAKVQAWVEFTVAKSATDTTDANYSADFAGTAVNAAKADGHSTTTHDPVVTMNTTKDVTKVVYNADGTATVGYSVTLHNDSQVNATDYAFKDTLSNGSVNADSVKGATYANGSFTVASIAAGADATVTYTSTVAKSSLSTENQVKPVDSKWNLTKDRVTGDKSDVATDAILSVGDTVWYKVTVDNTDGTQAISAADATVTDTFDNLNYVAAGSSSNGGTALDSAKVVTKNADGSITFAPGEVAAGKTAEFWIEFTVADSAVTDSTTPFYGSVVNRAKADSHGTTHVDPVVIPTTYAPSVTKAITGDTPGNASKFTFTMTAADDTTPMPEGKFGGTAQASVTGAGSVSYGDITYTKAGTYVYTLTENAGTGTDGYTYDTTAYTLTVTVTADASNHLVASAAITNADGKADSMTFTNVYKTPDVGIVKSVDKTDVMPGDQITYTLTVTNNGTSIANGTYVKDFVPANTTYVSSTGEGAQYGATTSGQEYVTWWIETLNPGESKTLTMTVKVNECQSGTKIDNVALISTDNPTRPNPETNPGGSSNTVTSVVGGSTTPSGPTVTGHLPKTGDTTLWGALGMAIVLAGGVILLVGLKRRRDEKNEHQS